MGLWAGFTNIVNSFFCFFLIEFLCLFLVSYLQRFWCIQKDSQHMLHQLNLNMNQFQNWAEQCFICVVQQHLVVLITLYHPTQRKRGSVSEFTQRQSFMLCPHLFAGNNSFCIVNCRQLIWSQSICSLHNLHHLHIFKSEILASILYCSKSNANTTFAAIPITTRILIRHPATSI